MNEQLHIGIAGKHTAKGGAPLPVAAAAAGTPGQDPLTMLMHVTGLGGADASALLAQTGGDAEAAYHQFCQIMGITA